MSAVPPRTSRVLIVEDHALIAQGLAFGLERDGYEVEVATDDALHDVPALVRRIEPDLVLLDLDLGADHPGGRSLIPELRALGPDVLVLSGVDDPVELGRCLQAGAIGLANKAEAFPVVLDKVRAVLAGASPTSDHDRADMVARVREHEASERERLEPFTRLTRREAEVLAALMDGQSTDEIAERFVVSATTVRTQIHAVLHKLGVHSQLAAAAMARRAGWSFD